MIQHTSATAAQEIMLAFAEQTGVTSSRPARRYLWTDAFAVCNLLGIYHQTSEPRFREHALLLVNQVHHLLGRHRPDDSRHGWISGLDDQEGEKHPTAGGLRIGKPLNERKPNEPFDESAEWDRDGQYYHYLTKWMHALYRVSQETGAGIFHRWAIELARAIHARFAYRSPAAQHSPGSGEIRLRWKMSIDLSYPLVPSQGQHDPLDGWITYQQLRANLPEEEIESFDLSTEIAELASICRGKSWASTDPLGLGGLMTDAYRVAQLTARAAFDDPRLLRQLLHDSAIGLEAYLSAQPLRRAADFRLAFRELGLAIGLRAVERLQALGEQAAAGGPELERLIQYLPLAEQIETFWLDPQHQARESWKAHRDINVVMLATSLLPDGYLQV